MTDFRRKFEIVAVALTGLGKLLFMDVLHWRLPFIVTATVGWAAYVIQRSTKVKGILQHWGFRSDNFKTVARRILPFGIVAVTAFLILGWQRGTLNLTWHIFPILMLYPLWGVVQQFLVIALVAGNLQDLKDRTINKSGIIIATAALFGLVHYPDYWLMAGTFILAVLYGIIYLKDRNIYVMGLFHGWLGAWFYYTVVGRDPFAEVFGKLLL